jgi:hypothetical protein
MQLKYFALSILIFFSVLENSFAAVTIVSCNLTNPSFGKISAGTSSSATFGVKTNTAAGTTIGGTGKMIATGNDGLLTINTTGTGRARVYITVPNFNMIKSGGVAISSMVSFSNTLSTRRRITSRIRSNPDTTNIPIFGYSTIGANQNAGTYSGNYQITICPCDIEKNKCPTSGTDKTCDKVPSCIVS